ETNIIDFSVVLNQATEQELINLEGFESSSFSGTIYSPAGGVSIQTTRPYSGSRSVRLRFGPDPDQYDDSTAELNFSLGGNYPDLWCHYYLWVPSNYFHRQ